MLLQTLHFKIMPTYCIHIFIKSLLTHRNFFTIAALFYAFENFSQPFVSLLSVIKLFPFKNNSTLAQHNTLFFFCIQLIFNYKMPTSILSHVDSERIILERGWGSKKGNRYGGNFFFVYRIIIFLNFLKRINPYSCVNSHSLCEYSV